MRSDQHEVAVGSDAGDAEEMSCHADDYAEFDDDGYDPSIGPDDTDEDRQDEDHEIEIEEIPEGGEGEDDDDVIDVDEEDGGVRLNKRGTLKNEARSKIHLLTHRYKNPYCESCVRAKMKHRKTFRGAFRRKLTKFGDLVTFDYVDNRRIAEQDYGDDKTIFVIRDRFTGSFNLTLQLGRILTQSSVRSSNSWAVVRLEKHTPMMPRSSTKP